MINTDHYYHTRFDRMADAIVDTMKEFGEKTIVESDRIHAQRMITIVNIFRKATRKNDNLPLEIGDKALLILGLVTIGFIGEKIANYAALKMIDVSLENRRGVELLFVSSIGDKVFRSSPYICNLLDPFTNHRKKIIQIITDDMHSCKLLGNFMCFDLKMLDDLLNDDQKKLQAPITFQCIWLHCKDSVVATLPPEVFTIINRMVMHDLRIELFGKIKSIVGQ